MSGQLIRVDVSASARDFGPAAYEPGHPAISPNSPGRGPALVWGEIVVRILGRFAAFSEWDGNTVNYFVQSDEHVRLENPKFTPLSEKQLKGAMRSERDSLKQRLATFTPAGATDRIVHRALVAAFDAIVAGSEPSRPPFSLFRYRDATGVWRLVWCWGYRPIGPQAISSKVCRNTECKLLYLVRPGESRKCPRCGIRSAKRLGWLKLAAALCLIVLMAVGKVWWYGRPTAILAGQVLDAVSGEPVAGATVNIDGMEAATETDEKGLFRIEHLPRGDVRLSLAAAGFREKHVRANLAAGRETESVIRLIGGASVVGEVFRPGGAPVPHAAVRVTESPLASRTDDEGRFRIVGIRGGRRVLEVEAEGFARHRLEQELPSEQETVVRVALTGTACLAGEVVSAADRKPLPGATVRITGTETSAVSGADGRFRIERLCTGHVAAEVQAPGFRTGRVEADLTQDKETPVRVELAGGAILAGKVLDSRTKAAVEGAEAAIAGVPLKSRTDVAGNFRLEGTRSGPASIEVGAPGYRTETLQRELAFGAETSIEVLLTGDGTVVGEVVAVPDNAPVAGAEAVLKGTPYSASADAKGCFRFDSIRSGPAVLEVRARGLGCQQVKLAVAAGRETPVKIALTGDTALSGKVVDTEGKPVREASVVLRGGTMETKTDRAGLFRFEAVRSGPAKIEVRAAGFQPSALDASLDSDKESEVRVTMTGDAVLTGSVCDADDRPIEGAEVRVAGAAKRATTSEDGTFRLEGLRSGGAQVLVRAAGLRSEEIEQALRPGQETRLRVKLSSDAVLAGEVVDAVSQEPIKNAEIRVANSPRQARSDDEGKFRIDGLRQGAAQVAVQAPGYRTKKGELQLGEERAAQLHVELQGDATLSGQVTSVRKNEPIADAQVTIAGTGHSAQTDEEGRFRFEGVPSGTVRLAATAVGFLPGGLEKPLEPGQEAAADIVLKPEAAEPVEKPSGNRLYAGRTGPRDKRTLSQLGGSEESEKAVALGLEWLARHQGKDGHWAPDCLRGRPGGCCESSSSPCPDSGSVHEPAQTGLAILAFQAGGHYYFNERPYSSHVRRGLDWLIEQQRPDGALVGSSSEGNGFGPHFMYEHGIAAFALAEACAVAKATGKKPDPKYYDAAKKAIRFIVQQQHADGGWRYTTNRSEESDTSVTGWQFLALKTAREAGIPIRNDITIRMRKYFKSVEITPAGKTAYTPHGGPGSDAMTGVGMLVYELLSKQPRSPFVVRGARYLGSVAERHCNSPDFYLLYNCTLAMFLAGGKPWEQWNDVVRDAVISRQRQDGCTRGSWDVGTGMGAQGGRICSTAWGVLTLEVYYRYAREGSRMGGTGDAK